MGNDKNNIIEWIISIVACIAFLGLRYWNVTERQKRIDEDQKRIDEYNKIIQETRRPLPLPINTNQSFETLKRRAEQGDAKAQYQLADYYMKNENCLFDFEENETSSISKTKNKAEAVKWLKKSAEQGDEKAQAALGGLYLTGVGVKKNETEAAKWFKLAAEQGNADALLMLGRCYYSGIGIEYNPKEAVKIFRSFCFIFFDAHSR